MHLRLTFPNQYPYYNRNTTDLQIWVTSDRTQSLSGTLSYQWFDFSGKPLSVGGTATIESKQNATSKGNGTNAKPEMINFNVGAINVSSEVEGVGQT